MRTKAIVKVWTDSGEEWATEFNGTEQDAIDYFLGQTFNIGTPFGEEDYLVYINRIQWEGAYG